MPDDWAPETDWAPRPTLDQLDQLEQHLIEDAEFVDAPQPAPEPTPAPTKPTEPSPTVQLREWFATKYEAFKLSPSKQGRCDLSLFNLTHEQIKEIGELLGKQS